MSADDWEMVVRDGSRTGVLVDPSHRLRGVHVHSAATRLSAGTVQRPGFRARPGRDAQRRAGPQAHRPQRHHPAGQARR